MLQASATSCRRWRSRSCRCPTPPVTGLAVGAHARITDTRTPTPRCRCPMLPLTDAAELRQVDLRQRQRVRRLATSRCTQPLSLLDHISWMRNLWPLMTWLYGELSGPAKPSGVPSLGSELALVGRPRTRSDPCNRRRSGSVIASTVSCAGDVDRDLGVRVALRVGALGGSLRPRSAGRSSQRVDRGAVAEVGHRVVAAERVRAAHAGQDALVHVRRQEHVPEVVQPREFRPWTVITRSTSACTCASVMTCSRRRCSATRTDPPPGIRVGVVDRRRCPRRCS